jgi:hypothetical protein
VIQGCLLASSARDRLHVLSSGDGARTDHPHGKEEAIPARLDLVLSWACSVLDQHRNYGGPPLQCFPGHVQLQRIRLRDERNLRKHERSARVTIRLIWPDRDESGGRGGIQGRDRAELSVVRRGLVKPMPAM